METSRAQLGPQGSIRQAPSPAQPNFFQGCCARSLCGLVACSQIGDFFPAISLAEVRKIVSIAAFHVFNTRECNPNQHPSLL
jgi:hypothetical protein